MLTRIRTSAAPAALAALALAGCSDDPQAPPQLTEAILFERYVALGNSITAGFQSGGINDSTQRQAYPALLAVRAGASFGIPAFALPGCPPPLLSATSAGREGGASGLGCALRKTPGPGLVQNLAVPGFKLRDALDNRGSFAGGNPLAALILSGSTQTEAMIQARPSLVSVWLGNNDALGAALGGDTTALTAEAAFAASLDQLAAAIQSTTARAVILIGVVEPTVAPALQPGAFLWVSARTGLLQRPVSDECAPGTPGGRNLVFAAVFVESSASEIRCIGTAPGVLDPAEQQAVARRVAAFNARLQAVASAKGWIYLDPNAVLRQELNDPARVRRCQGLAAATTLEAARPIVEATCPGPSAVNFWGSLISFDAVHPSAEAHGLIANAVATALNQKLGLQLATR